jgi:predicted molibdopterin-dependent oxidoreductase YjgC
MGTLPDFLPGYQSVTDARARKRFEDRWGVTLPTEAGLTALELMEQAKEGTIKGMYIVGENPALSFPHSGSIEETLGCLDLLVVQDLFLTETATLAHVVLPAASFAERGGTFTNFEGRVQRVQKAIEPLGESLPDWQVILRLADKMGYPLSYASPQQVMDEIADMCQLPAYTLYERVGYVEPEPKNSYQPESSSSSWGVGRIQGGAFLKGFARFCPVEYVSKVPRREDYPLILLTGATLYHLGSGSRSSRSWRLKKFSAQAFVEISELDAHEFGVGNGDQVKIISPISELTTTVRIAHTISKGVLFMPTGFPETPVTKLFDITLDTESKTPSLTACNVRIEKAHSHG